jgi:hypothetical protein
MKKSKLIITTGLIAGILDGLAAVISFMLKGGKDPQVIFKFIASAIFGNPALSGGVEMVFAGVIFHLCIAMIWTILFFSFYERFKIYALNWIAAGLWYGVVVWVCMNGIVVPLSNASPISHTALSVAIGVTVLMVCIGLPISYGAKKYFQNT